MNVLDKLSILSAMINCERCDNCIAKGYCNTMRKKDYIVEIIVVLDDNGNVYCSCDTHKEAADEIAEAKNN